MRLLTAAIAALAGLALLAPGYAQDPNSDNPKDRIKAAKNLREQGSAAIPTLEKLLSDPDTKVRREAAGSLVEIGTQHSLDPLVQATRDADSEVQITAVNGLVNFYLPGYVKTGIGGALSNASTSVKGHFTDVNDAVIPPDMEVAPAVISAIGKVASGGSSMESRAAAARAVGVLRGQAAVPDLLEAVRSKNTGVILESLIALKKIRDQSAAKDITFLLRDLDEDVQIAAIETTGLLRNFDALPQLYDVLNDTRDKDVRRAALTAIAMLPDERSRNYYVQYLIDKDADTRAAAAEGIARLKKPDDVPMMQRYFEAEKKMNPRLSMAFALVTLGQTELSEFSPLQYLINTLNSSYFNGVAQPFLIELARDETVREKLYQALPGGTADEKIKLAQVLARSGDQESVPHLETLTRDPEAEVAAEASRSLRILRARLR